MTQQIKPWRSLDEQLAILQQRGMIIDDPDAAKSYLQRLGYYRLSGYWYPFRKLVPVQASDNQTPRRLDEFVEGTHFADVVRLYIFDKKLRILALDALERIEMAVRVDIAHLLGKIDPYAHEHPECLHERFSKQKKSRGPAQGRTEHVVWLEKYQRCLERARRVPFVEHYLEKYGKLPIWVAIEVWDFGMMSQLYSGMKLSDQNSVAIKYGVDDGKAFRTWLRSLNFIRNVSAHHSRLWNINVLERAPIPPGAEYWQGMNNARPFFYFCLMRSMLQVICPNSKWHKRFADVMAEFPQVPSGAVRLEDFGIVEGWLEWDLWGLK